MVHNLGKLPSAQCTIPSLGVWAAAIRIRQKYGSEARDVNLMQSLSAGVGEGWEENSRHVQTLAKVEGESAYIGCEALPWQHGNTFQYLLFSNNEPI